LALGKIVLTVGNKAVQQRLAVLELNAGRQKPENYQSNFSLQAQGSKLLLCNEAITFS
jgi:hypothetical protein